jgi:hypothetical protein
MQGLWWCTVQSDERKDKEDKSHTQAQNKYLFKTDVFMVSSYLFGTALTCHFGTSMQCAQQPRGSSLCGFHVAFHMLRLLDAVSR